MSGLITCPHCGLAIAPGLDSGPPRGVAKPATAPSGEAEIASIDLFGPGSNDDNFPASSFGPKPTPAVPDPNLGPFEAPAPTTTPAGDARVPVARTPGSGASFPPSDFSAPALATGRPRDRRTPEGPEGVSGSSDGDENPRPSTPWPVVLLGSYASATTLALGWLLFGPNGRDRNDLDVPPAADGRVDPGRQAGLSRKLDPIAESRLLALGQALQVGSLEVTPLDVKRQAVTLQRVSVTAQPVRRDGGKGAFVLRLRLRNTSKDAVFAPVDQAFVRERGRGVVDSFIETAGGKYLYPYPLAVESEWSIVGQDFDELRPGESRVVAIVGAPDAPGDDQGPFTWRIRLRTGIGQTEVIGVRWPDPAAGGPPKS